MKSAILILFVAMNVSAKTVSSDVIQLNCVNEAHSQLAFTASLKPGVAAKLKFYLKDHSKGLFGTIERDLNTVDVQLVKSSLSHKLEGQALIAQSRTDYRVLELSVDQSELKKQSGILMDLDISLRTIKDADVASFSRYGMICTKL